MRKNTKFFIFTFILFLLFSITLFTEQIPGESGSTDNEKSCPRTCYKVDYRKKETQEFIFPGNSGKLRIPAGSLDEDTTIDLRIDEKSSYDETKFRQCGPSYKFSPHGLKFKRDIYMTISYHEPEEDDFPETYIQVYHYDPETQQFQVMQKVSQDKINNKITVRTRHFSEYVPGVGSYQAEEGLSPNSCYFKNNNEKVDRYRGTLILTRDDIRISGRGLDLNITSVFNSDNFYSWFKDENNWSISPFTRVYGKYRIARGWRLGFPFFFSKITGEFITDLSYITESGQIYQLTSAIVNDIAIINDHKQMTFTYEELGGYRVYNESFHSDSNYTRIIELIREKQVISCDVYKKSSLGNEFQITNLHINYPDGRKIFFHAPQGESNTRGKIDMIYDATMKNSISFTYRADNGKIDYVTDTIGRELHFEYLDDDSCDYINLYLKEGNEKHYLVQYRINKQNELEKIIYLKHDTGEPVSETTYGYSHTADDLWTKITCPYGGESIYHYAETYCARVYRWPRGSFSKQKPMVSKHYLKKSSTTPESETRYTSFSYYNSDGENHLIKTTIGAQRMLSTFPRFIPGTM